MNINCPYGLGDTLTAFPKLVTLIEEDQVDNINFYLNGYYPHLLYSLLINFDFQVPTNYIMGKPLFTDIEVHPFKIDKMDITDSPVSDKYWYMPYPYANNIKNEVELIYRSLASTSPSSRANKNSELLDLVSKLKSHLEMQTENVILNRFIKDYKEPYQVIFQPFTSLRTIRGVSLDYVERAFYNIVTGLSNYSIALVGTYSDYTQIRDIVDKYSLPNVSFLMATWDISEVAQAIFQADIIVGCDSWVAYLGAMLNKRSGMYMLGHKILPEFANRIHSSNFYGFENISVINKSEHYINWDKFIEFLRS